MRTKPIVPMRMENLNVSFKDIAYRNGSETVIDWYRGKTGLQFADKQGILRSWSTVTDYDGNQHQHIIPVGVIQEDGTGNVRIVPANRITIK